MNVSASRSDWRQFELDAPAHESLLDCPDRVVIGALVYDLPEEITDESADNDRVLLPLIKRLPQHVIESPRQGSCETATPTRSVRSRV